MLGYDELIDRLRRLNEDASFLDDQNTYKCIIVGGGALILLGYRQRATHDIDVIDYFPPDIKNLMEKYDINTNVSAHIDCFPEDYINRAQLVNLDTEKIKFYTLSLEDLVISKLAAARDKDWNDITTEAILHEVDWIKLDELAKEVKQSLLSERDVSEFQNNYDLYKRRYKNASIDI